MCTSMISYCEPDKVLVTNMTNGMVGKLVECVQSNRLAFVLVCLTWQNCLLDAVSACADTPDLFALDALSIRTRRA